LKVAVCDRKKGESMKKVYLDDTNYVSTICPKCGFEKKIDMTNFKETEKKLTVECRCGENNSFLVEFRKQYRKNVRLPGEYIIRQSKEKGEILIRELSLKGIRFESLRPHNISKNDTLDVTFKLDNPMRSKISRIFKVIWIKDRMIGANCIEPKLYEKDLGFYLQP
jgi:hypothetical protein